MIYPTMKRANARYRGPMESEKMASLFKATVLHLDQIKDELEQHTQNFKKHKEEFMSRRFTEKPFIVGKTDNSSSYDGFAYVFPLIDQPKRILLDTYTVIKRFESYDPPFEYTPSPQGRYLINEVIYLDKISEFKELDMTSLKTTIDAQVYIDIEQAEHEMERVSYEYSK